MVFVVAVFLSFFSFFYLVSLSCTRSISLVPNPVCVNQLSHCHETPSLLVQPQHRSSKGDEYVFYDPSAIPHLPFPLPNSLPMSRRPCPSLHSPPSLPPSPIVLLHKLSLATFTRSRRAGAKWETRRHDFLSSFLSCLVHLLTGPGGRGNRTRGKGNRARGKSQGGGWEKGGGTEEGREGRKRSYPSALWVVTCFKIPSFHPPEYFHPYIKRSKA